MNERIRQLAEQAGLNFGTNISGVELVYGTFEGSVISHIDSDELEKFAELIVKECGVALSPMLRDMVSRGQAYNLIKEHFGVEQ